LVLPAFKLFCDRFTKPYDRASVPQANPSINPTEEDSLEKIAGKFQLEQIDSRGRMMNRKVTLQFDDTHLESI